MARRPAGGSSTPRTWSSRSQESLDRPAASARHRGRDHDQDGRDDDADDPPDPVNAARRLNTQRCGQVVADEHAADPTDNGEPDRNVVAVARREELAQCADDDACDDHTDEVHIDSFTCWGRSCSRRCGSPRPAEGSNQQGIIALLRFADPSLNTRGTASTFAQPPTSQGSMPLEGMVTGIGDGGVPLVVEKRANAGSDTDAMRRQ